jgi:hypothetical protein
LHFACLFPRFAAVRACTIACYLPFTAFCSCLRVPCCILVAFCRGLQLYSRAVLHSSCLLPCFAAVRTCTIACYLPFAVFCSCTHVHNCMLLAFYHGLRLSARALLNPSCLCRGLQLYARAVLYYTCLLLCFAAVRACHGCILVAFAGVCSCTRVLCSIILAFCRVLQPYARAQMHVTCLCRVFQLYLRAVLHSSCLLPWFAAVRACRVAF